MVERTDKNDKMVRLTQLARLLDRIYERNVEHAEQEAIILIRLAKSRAWDELVGNVNDAITGGVDRKERPTQEEKPQKLPPVPRPEPKIKEEVEEEPLVPEDNESEEDNDEFDIDNL